MTRKPTTQFPVLIVGAGAAGLTAAVTLARQGIECLLVERRPQLSSLPRATAISTRSMELLRSFGLEDEIRAGEVEVEWIQWFSETLAGADAGEGKPTGFPSRSQSAVVSPTAPACVPQDHLEPVLMDHFLSLGVGRAELGVEAVTVEQHGDEVRVRLRHVASGIERSVRARYLIAADGAHSAVRGAVGIQMRGPDPEVGAVSSLFRAPLWDVVGDKRAFLYAVMRPEAEGVFLPAGRDRWLYGVVAPLDSPAMRLNSDGMARRIRMGVGAPGIEPQIERTGRFTFAVHLAERYREGNVFLTGDAAHRATPRGGTGMNTAIHDGYDLGWKLSWVLNGWAGDELLDTYEEERRPVAAHNIAQSAETDATTRAAGHALHADLGGRVRHVWVDGTSTVDLLGPGLTVFSGHARPQLASSAPVTSRTVDAITARALGIPAGGSLVVRPDGMPAGELAHGLSDRLAA